MTIATVTRKKGLLKTAGSLLAVGVLSATLAAQTPTADRYDNQIQTTVTQNLTAKTQFRDLEPRADAGIVTLTGTLALSPRNLHPPKLPRKTPTAQAHPNPI